jgi:hypothetical protein
MQFIRCTVYKALSKYVEIKSVKTKITVLNRDRMVIPFKSRLYQHVCTCATIPAIAGIMSETRFFGIANSCSNAVCLIFDTKQTELTFRLHFI